MANRGAAALAPAPSGQHQLAFLAMIRDAVDEGGQFIIATHSPILLACPGAQIFGFDGARIEEMNYQETAHYQIYRQFFMDRAASPEVC